MNFTRNAINEFRSCSSHLYQMVIPCVMSTAIQLGLQDKRIGKIVAGVGFAASGCAILSKSGASQLVKSCLRWIKREREATTEDGPPSNAVRWGATAVGLTATCYGVYNIASGILELYAPQNNTQLFLVVHDNKPSHEEKMGRPLPRLGVVAIETGDYEEVYLRDASLRNSKDLESLIQLESNEYITCESKGNCFHFELSKNDTHYSASVKNEFSLPGKPIFFSIESIAFKNTTSNELCWSHRGGMFENEEPWMRCTVLKIPEEILDYTEMELEDPFGYPNALNRASSDHTFGLKTGLDYRLATIDTEGSDGIAPTGERGYSFLYVTIPSQDQKASTLGPCIAFFPEQKGEALYVNADETFALIATDNETEGSRIYKFHFHSSALTSIDVRKGEEYGIGGIAPIEE